MGTGSVSSHRWHRGPTPTIAGLQQQVAVLERRAKTWESDALQLRSERDQLQKERDELAKTCERLALKLAEAARARAYGSACEQLFGFQTPAAPRDIQRHPLLPAYR